MNSNSCKVAKDLPLSASSRAGSLLFVSGQGSLDPLTGAVVGVTIEEQTAQTMENIRVILAEDNLNFSHVKKVNIFLSSRELYGAFN